MRERYDFADSKPNPYAKRMRRQVTIRLGEDTITYFKAMADRKGLPYYQSLINLHLRECAESNRELRFG